MVDVVLRDPSSSKGMAVTDDGHGEVLAITVPTIEHISDESGLAFSWSSTFVTGANEEWFSIQNDATDLLLHIDYMYVGSIILAVSTANRRTSGTAAGTAVVGVPLNFDKGKTAEATAFGNNEVTGTLAGDIVAHVLTPADDMRLIDFRGAVILGKDDVFFLSGVTATTYFSTVFGHFDE